MLNIRPDPLLVRTDKITVLQSILQSTISYFDQLNDQRLAEE